MKEKSILREMEKCKDILNDRKLKTIIKNSVMAYYKSLQEDLHDIYR
jgi:hypothetical protein